MNEITIFGTVLVLIGIYVVFYRDGIIRAQIKWAKGHDNSVGKKILEAKPEYLIQNAVLIGIGMMFLGMVTLFFSQGNQSLQSNIPLFASSTFLVVGTLGLLHAMFSRKSLFNLSLAVVIFLITAYIFISVAGLF